MNISKIAHRTTIWHEWIHQDTCCVTFVQHKLGHS